MHWLPIAILAYFLTALGVIFDKFLLSSRRISHPVIYAFYSSVLSLSAFLFFPWGFHWTSPEKIFFSFFFGIIFSFGILFLFWALAKNDAGQVVPAVGAVIPVVSYLFSFIFLGERLGLEKNAGGVLLVLGGLLISWNFSRKNRRISRFFPGFSHVVWAGIFLGAAFVGFKILFNNDNFVNVYIWTRVGILLGGLGFLLHPQWRKIIFRSLKKFKKPKEENRRSGFLFVLGKILNGLGSLFLNLAISLGSVALVNALVSIEYAFIFLLALAASFWRPDFFQEKKDRTVVLQKISALLIIAGGLYLIAS